MVAAEVAAALLLKAGGFKMRRLKDIQLVQGKGPLGGDMVIFLSMRSLIEDEPKQIGAVENAHALLKAVYRNPALDLSIRMRAASMAIAYEMPKLAVVAQVSESDFAEVLERRLKNMERLNGGRTKVIEAPTKMIEAPGSPANRR